MAIAIAIFVVGLLFFSFDLQFRRWLGKKRGWRCERCGRAFDEGWLLEFHHKIPKSLGGEDTEENAEILCLGCHVIRHKEIEENAKVSVKLIEMRLKRNGGRRQ